jgi:tripartite-type tricarboxylate transporter receptor subunit TctC
MTLVRLALASLLLATPAHADDIEKFYAGKTFSVNVGFSAGGVFDAYGRILSRHIGKHIPGKPNVIVQNTPGAGGRRLAQTFQTLGPHDGTTIGITTPGIVMDQAMQSDATYDLRKFHWIGSPADEVNVLWIWHTSPAKNFEDTKRIETPMSSTGPGAANYFVPRVFNQRLGTKFKVITGYPGATEADLAIERGEAAGRVSGWAGLKTTSDWVASGKTNVLVQIGLRKLVDLPNIPLMADLATTAIDRQVFEFLAYGPAMGRPFFMPPNTPPERVAAIRRAFEETLRDPGFLDEAKRGQLDVAPVSGDDLTALVMKSFALAPEALAIAKAAME